MKAKELISLTELRSWGKKPKASTSEPTPSAQPEQKFLTVDFTQPTASRPPKFIYRTSTSTPNNEIIEGSIVSVAYPIFYGLSKSVYGFLYFTVAANDKGTGFTNSNAEVVLEGNGLPKSVLLMNWLDRNLNIKKTLIHAVKRVPGAGISSTEEDLDQHIKAVTGHDVKFAGDPNRIISDLLG